MSFECTQILNSRYELVRSLGSNGPKQTWLARDRSSRCEVTLKSLFFGQGMTWEEFKLFEREGETLKSLSHPRIPHFLDAFGVEEPEGSYFCLVQEYIPGRSVEERVRSGGRFSETEVICLARDVLEILDYLHRCSPPVLHRDIKPNNLIWGDDEKIYLVDFGAVQASRGESMTVVGTYGYMPPEQFGGRAVPASDLYSLGCTLIYLLTGSHPADLPQKEQRIDFAPLVQASPFLIGWISRMIQPSLARRYASAAECLAVLDKPFRSPIPDTAMVGPVGSHILIRSTEDNFDLSIPRRAVRLQDFSRLGSITMAVVLALFSTSFAMLAHLPLWLLLLAPIPWLLALGILAWQLWPLFGWTRLRIRRGNFYLEWGIPGLFKFRKQGSTTGLWASCTSWFHGSEHETRICFLQEGIREYPFAWQLSLVEQDWLVGEIREWLRQSRSG